MGLAEETYEDYVRGIQRSASREEDVISSSLAGSTK